MTLKSGNIAVLLRKGHMGGKSKLARRLRIGERKRIRISGRGINCCNVFPVRLVEEIDTYTHKHTHIYTYKHNIYKHTYTYMHTNTHTHIYIHINTHICTHKHLHYNRMMKVYYLYRDTERDFSEY